VAPTTTRAGACGSNHLVGVYDADHDLVAAVAAFLQGALSGAGAAVVIATATHRAAVEANLAARGYRLDALTASGQYIAIDAGDTLARFMRQERPDARKLATVIGGILEQAGNGPGPVRVFGEMVDLLWNDGNVAAAIELESLWNDLANRHTFALFCGYAMSSLETAGDLSAVKQMCDRHSNVLALSEGSSPSVRGTRVGGCDDRDNYDRLFVAAPTVLRDVRRFVRDVLRAWGEADELGSTVEIVASELATNAVQHAQSPFSVSLSRSCAAIGIAVRDVSFVRPEHIREGAEHAGGRGVRLVAALSSEWGTIAEADGKTVWADVARATTA
jgi:anti-sigma regulatory factor (Ser/Thr protein kinase)